MPSIEYTVSGMNNHGHSCCKIYYTRREAVLEKIRLEQRGYSVSITERDLCTQHPKRGRDL